MTRLFPPDADCVALIHAQFEHLLKIDLPAFAHGSVRLTPESISALVETAFWAGLQTNEGRTMCVRIAIASPELLPGATRFDCPSRYEPAEIVRLAPAVASDRCLCAVEVDQKFQIWGFTDRLAIRGLHTVVVETTEPGTVRVDVAMFRPFAILNGRTNEILGATGSDLAHFLRRKLQKVLPSADWLESQAIWRECLALADLVRTILHEGHGGAVLIVPSDTDGWHKSLSSFPYRLKTSDTRVPDAIRKELSDTDRRGKLFQDLSQAALPEGLKARIYDDFPWSPGGGEKTAMQTIAPLAGVDGAVVMTRDLKLLVAYELSVCKL